MDSSEFDSTSTAPETEGGKSKERARKPDQLNEPMDKALVARLVIGAIILAGCITFAAQNLDGVETQFLGWSFQMSQFLLMLLSAVAGVLIWEVAGAYSRRAKKKRS